MDQTSEVTNHAWPGNRAWRVTRYCGQNAKKVNTKKIPLSIGTWNVRTLLDLNIYERPERRTALVSRELARFNIDIAALSETRLPGEGKLEEDGSGYTFVWKGKDEAERREHGVGFAIKTSIFRDHQMTLTAISERLMTLRVPLPDNNFMTLISSYAPTLDADEDLKNHFYQQLNNTIRKVPPRDHLLLLGDFNARVGKDHQLWEDIIGKEGIGNCNANGFLLLGLCAEHNLSITNTMYRLPNRYKTTWQHPRSKHWHMLDYVIVRQSDRKYVRVTKAVLGADDCWTDHRLVVSRLTLAIQRKLRVRSQEPSRRKYDISKLKDPAYSTIYEERVCQDLATIPTSNNLEEEWTFISNTISNAAKDTIGYNKKKNQDWFDENDNEISRLIDAKRMARLAHEQDTRCQRKKACYHDLKKLCQTKLREIQNQWWTQKAVELQQYADSRDLRNFYAGTKELYGPVRSSVGSLLSADSSTILTDPTDILERWRDHFYQLLNRPSTAADDFLKNVQQHPVQLWMNESPTLLELEKAMSQMKARKSPGPDNIPFELLQYGGMPLKTRLHDLILKIWTVQQVPKDLKDAVIITLFKKGDRKFCGNYRGISLLSIAGKIFARILLSRLQEIAEQILPESQCGFRASRGTTDMIFCARQLQEKSREQQKPLFIVFYDLEKAFDRVPRAAMWRVLKRFGCPDNYISLVRALHENTSGRVLHQGKLSEEFEITCGLKQGCVLAPTLFALYLAAMMHEIPSDNPGVDIRYRLDSGLFNLAKFRSKQLTTIKTVTELQYADDNAAFCHSADDLQRSVNNFTAAYQRFGMSVNIQKTKVLAQPAPRTALPEFDITISGTSLKKVDQFSYLGSLLTSKCNSEKDIEHRVAAAHIAYGKLCRRVFDNKDLTRRTKLMVYEAVVVSTLLYGCETWTLYRRDLKKLECFHQQKLRSMLCIKWKDHITNNEVLYRANSQSMESTIMRHRLRWSGHVARMPETRLPRQILFSELATGGRPRGRPVLRYKDQLKATLRSTTIEPETWEAVSSDRSIWRNTIRAGTERFETMRKERDEEKRQARRLRLTAPRPPPTIQCPSCPRKLYTRIGLHSHLRHHK